MNIDNYNFYGNYENNDNSFSIYEIHKRQRKKEIRRVRLYKKILNRCFYKINSPVELNCVYAWEFKTFSKVASKKITQEILKYNGTKSKLENEFERDAYRYSDLYEQGRYEDALIEAMSLSIKDSQFATYHNILGKIQQALNNLEIGIKSFKNAAKAIPFWPSFKFFAASVLWIMYWLKPQ